LEDLVLNQHGFEGAQWEEAKRQATEILVRIARRCGRIAYSELVPEITALRLDAHDPRSFHLLGEISSEEDAAGRGMLTAIVVHKSGDMQPGPGFFELAKTRGRDTRDLLACWIKEFNKVHDHWANRNPVWPVNLRAMTPAAYSGGCLSGALCLMIGGYRSEVTLSSALRIK